MPLGCDGRPADSDPGLSWNDSRSAASREPQGRGHGKRSQGKRRGLRSDRSVLSWECGSGARRPHARIKPETPPFKGTRVVALRTGNPRRHPERMQMACQSQFFLWPAPGMDSLLQGKASIMRQKRLFSAVRISPAGKFQNETAERRRGAARRILHRAPQNAARDAVPWPRRRRDSAGVSDCRYDPRWRPCLPLITSPPRS